MKTGKLQIVATTMAGVSFTGFTTTEDLHEYEIDESISWLTEALDEENIGRLVLYSHREGFNEDVYDKIVIPGLVLQECTLRFLKWMNDAASV